MPQPTATTKESPLVLPSPHVRILGFQSRPYQRRWSGEATLLALTLEQSGLPEARKLAQRIRLAAVRLLSTERDGIETPGARKVMFEQYGAVAKARADAVRLFRGQPNPHRLVEYGSMSDRYSKYVSFVCRPKETPMLRFVMSDKSHNGKGESLGGNYTTATCSHYFVRKSVNRDGSTQYHLMLRSGHQGVYTIAIGKHEYKVDTSATRKEHLTYGKLPPITVSFAQIMKESGEASPPRKAPVGPFKQPWMNELRAAMVRETRAARLKQGLRGPLGDTELRAIDDFILRCKKLFDERTSTEDRSSAKPK